MRVKFFAIPALEPVDAEADLNRFLAQHRVLSVDRELVQKPSGVFWALSVTYLERPATASSPKPPKVDYKEKLSPEDFEVYAQLRKLRKDVADREGVPAYAVFNNAQLAEMVETRIRSLEALGKIAGIGESRLQSFGEEFLERLAKLQSGQPNGEAKAP